MAITASILPKPTYALLSKSAIPAIFQRHRPGLDSTPYLAAAHVFPMRVNKHVTDDLIDWRNVPTDPMFQLSFPQPEMMAKDDLSFICNKLRKQETSRVEMREAAESIRTKMNPHPARQKEENVPREDGMFVPGMQHKYRETVLFFPAEGQFCHAFCTYCFRWAQFTSVGSEQTFKSNNGEQLRRYVAGHPGVSDVLFTGGDPMVMPIDVWRRYVNPLIGPQGPPNLATIRIGTKSLAWWPYRYLSSPDSTEILKMFEDITGSGRQLAIQAHFSHPRELRHPAAQEAIRLIRMTGAQIRTQGPLIRHVNDSADVWRDMWNLQVRLGLVPYYMFVERDTGAADYFATPLTKALEIFGNAYSGLGGTARTVRGPSMSAAPGKVCVLGEDEIMGEKVFVLKMLQARDPRWTKRVFFARYDPNAVWFGQLKPAFGQDRFFFEDDYKEISARTHLGSSGQLQQ